MNYFSKKWAQLSGYIQASSLFKKLIVVNHTKVSPVQRLPLDVLDFKNAITSAEGYGQQRKKLYDIYKNVLLDEQVGECIEKRMRHVCRNLILMHDSEEIEEVSKLTKKTFFKKALKEALNARFWGHTVLELDWSTSGEGVTAVIDRRHVKPRFGIVTENPFDLEGLHYRELPFNRNVIECGEDEDLGLLLRCAFPSILRRNNFSNWAEFAEVMGIPTRVGKYSNEQTRGVLEEAFDKIGAAGWIVMPDDGEFEQINPTNVGQNSNIFDMLHRAVTNSISIALLGNTMTTNEAKNSGYAQSKTHQDDQKDVFTDDRDYITSWLNEKLIPYLRRIGFQIPEGAEWVYEEKESLSTKERLELGSILKRNGVPVGMSWWYETSGIPMPEPDDLPPESNDTEEEDE